MYPQKLFSCLQSINDGKYSSPCFEFLSISLGWFHMLFFGMPIINPHSLSFSPSLLIFLVNIKRPVMRLSCCLDKQIAQRGVRWHVGSPWASCQIWNQFFSSLLAFQFWGRFRSVLFRKHFYKEQLFSKTVCILAWLKTIFSTTDLRIETELDTCSLSTFKTH